MFALAPFSFELENLLFGLFELVPFELLTEPFALYVFEPFTLFGLEPFEQVKQVVLFEPLVHMEIQPVVVVFAQAERCTQFEHYALFYKPNPLGLFRFQFG